MYPVNHGRLAVFEQYDVDAQILGAGAFGQVTAATHRLTGQRRACKCIGLAGPADKATVDKEIQLLKSLDHPNILRLSECFVDGRNMHLITELCEGGSLLKGFVLRASATAAARCMSQILSATAYCHERGIVHRDLKPDNVLYVSAKPDSAVKVIDFGLADALSRLRGLAAAQRPIERAGTFAFMAPEMICSSGAYGEKVDTWAIGCILFLLLTGEHPFCPRTQANAAEVRARVARADLIQHPNWHAAPPGVRDLTRRLLTVDPDARASAKEALSHAWLAEAARAEIAATPSAADGVPKSVFEGLGKYHASSRLKRAVLKLLAKEVDESRMGRIREHFKRLDGRQDGYLSRDELLHALQTSEMPHLTAADLHWILPPGAGDRISYTEFTAALLAKEGFSRAELLNAFRRCDVRREGRISLEALSNVLKNAGPVSCVEAFREAGVGRAGAIDFEEFCALVAT